MQERPPAVSVVIPAYNAASFITATLESVRAQSFKDYEIVVVDDGSFDQTCETVENYLKQNGLPGHCVRQPNKKIAGARNRGMQEARGAYIALLDHDDLWLPEKLEAVLAEFALHPEAGLICHNEKVTRSGTVVSVTRNGPAVPRMYERLLFQGNCLSPSATVFRRDLALSIGGFRENEEFNTVEDYDFWMRLSRATTFHFLDRVLGTYQLVDRAASRRVEYHHANLEALLREHLANYFGERPGLLARLRMGRRLSSVHRSALRLLMGYHELPEKQRSYAFKMLRESPFDPKNILTAAAWAGRRLLRRT